MSYPARAEVLVNMINILSNKYNILFYHAFVYSHLLLRLDDWLLSGQLIQFSFRTIYILTLIWFFFYNVYFIMFVQRGKFGRHFIISSFSYNAEYWVWNAHTIMTCNATFHIPSDVNLIGWYLLLYLVTWPQYHNQFNSYVCLNYYLFCILL